MYCKTCLFPNTKPDINFNSQINYFKIYPINNIELSQILEFSFNSPVSSVAIYILFELNNAELKFV